MRAYILVFPVAVMVLLIIFLLFCSNSDEHWASDGILNETKVLNGHIYSEDGYWINRYQIRGYTNREIWPGKFTIYAYVTGGTRHPIKSGFTNRSQADEWLSKFLENSLREIKENE